jgi:glycosyltransferase involved in cell wall biosynthesis
LRYREDVPFAMIVHDTMSSVTVPDALVDSCGPAHQRLLYLAARARVVVCISEATRQDLLAFAPLDGSRVTTVLSGNMLQPTIAAWQADLPSRFLLFVGERSGRKSFDLLVRSLPAVLARHPEVKLVVTGALSRWELDFLRRWGVEEAVIGIAADDTTLQALYRQAVCLVYPSLYEGFGLPPLEAMSLGCPVIATAVRATREICGEAALLVPPLDGKALEAAILRLLEEPELRQQLGQSGKMQAGRFAFTRMMDEMNNVLRQAV